MKLALPFLAGLLLAAGAYAQEPKAPTMQPTTTAPAATQPAATQPTYENPGLHPRVRLTTTKGDIVLELNAEAAPQTVDNFIKYVESGYYNGTIFHRVKSDFMIQAGGYTPDMTEKTEGLREPIRNEWNSGLRHDRGTIAMARGQIPDSATSQFFINVVDNTRLNAPQPDGAGYAVFGKVVEGMDVVDTIQRVAVTAHPKLPPGDGPGLPVNAITIEKAEVVGKYDQKAVDQRIAKIEEEIAEMEKRSAAEREEALEAAIKRLQEETGKEPHKTDSGLIYFILEEGAGDAPQPDEMVEVNYTASLVDGTKFETTQGVAPIKLKLSDVNLKGFVEAAGMMKPGAKWKLILPHELGFGEHGRPPIIPGKATVIFDVELLRVVKEANMDEYIKQVEQETGKEAQRTDSGLAYVILKEGTGPQPSRTDKVTVHYTGWLLDGTKFDSSVDRGQPFTFALSGGVIQGWLEGVAMMKVGEKRKLIIPPALGYGARGAPPKIGPNEPLVFDVELLEIAPK